MKFVIIFFFLIPLFFGCRDYIVDSSFQSRDSLLYYPTNEISFFNDYIIINPEMQPLLIGVKRDLFGLVWENVSSISYLNQELGADFLVLNSSGNIHNDFDLNKHSKRRSNIFYTNKNGNIYVSSFTYSITFDSCHVSSHISKFDLNGNIDSSFKFINDKVIATILCEYEKNKLIIVYSDSGKIKSNKICIIDTLGNILPYFKISQQKLFSGDEEFISSLTVLKNKKILLGGYFKDILGKKCSSNIILLNADGTIDTTFNKDGEGFNGVVNRMIVLSDKRILVCGNFSSYNKNICPIGLIKLNYNGQFDSTFNQGGKGFTLSFQDESKYSNGYVSDIDIFDNGDILVGGGFSHYNSQKTARNIAVITQDGELSKKYFYFNSGFDSYVNKVKIKNNDTIYISSSKGYFNCKSYGQSLLRFTKQYTFPNLIYHLF